MTAGGADAAALLQRIEGSSDAVVRPAADGGARLDARGSFGRPA